MIHLKTPLVLVILTVGLLSVFFAGCISNIPKFINDTPENIVDGDIVVDFDENPSTGFEWVYTIEPASSLEVVEDRYQSDQTSEEPACGGGGHHRWVFNAKEDGNVRIHFLLVRGDELIDEALYEYQIKDLVPTLTNDPFYWTCHFCDATDNRLYRQYCENCRKARDGFTDGWACDCGRLNHADATTCEVCGETRRPDSGWICPCGKVIFDSERTVCPECGTARAESSSDVSPIEGT